MESGEADWGLKTRKKDKLVLWVRDEPFEMGCLPINPCPKISLAILKKIVKYVRLKNILPELNLAKWHHICKYKLLLDGFELGWTYIRLYDILFQQMDREEKYGNYWDRRCEALRTQKRDPRKEFKVPTLKFLLYLYIQHSYRIICRINTVSTAIIPAVNSDEDDEILVETINYDDGYSDTETRGERGERKIISEQLQYDLIISQAMDIVEFLESDIKSDSDREPSPRLDVEVVEALSLILCGTLTPNKSADSYNIEELIRMDGFSHLVEFDAGTNTVNRRKFVSWIRKYLKIYPWGSASCLLRNPIIKIPTGVGNDSECPAANRIMCNNQPSPHCWYVISNVHDQVLFIDNIPKFASVRISRCNNAYIYLPGIFSCVTVNKCNDSTIFLGCVAKIFRSIACVAVNFLGQIRQLVACDCVICEYSIHTSCGPILVGSRNSNCIFGPYSTYYPQLKKHMTVSKFGVNLSLWNDILSIGGDGNITPLQQWQLQEPSRSFELVFPFRMNGRTSCNPVTLPEEYEGALEEQRNSTSKMWESKAKEMELTPEQTQRFKSIMYTRFLKWLHNTGLDVELVALKSYQETLKTESKKPVFIKRTAFHGPPPESLLDVIRVLPLESPHHRTSFFQ